MWIVVKFVITDDTLNYYPCVRIFADEKKARDFKSEMETELEKQTDKLDSIFVGKILSEIYISEIKLDQE
jgi:hypothetical protein